MDFKNLKPVEFMGRGVEYEEAGALIVPLPYASVPHTENTKNSPSEILLAWNFEEFDLELGYEPSSVGIYPLPERQYPCEKGLAEIQKLASDIFDGNRFPIFLGGDHSITIPINSALKDVSIICFDAHTDLKDEYEGSRLSHMCVNRRISENNEVYLIGNRSVGREEFDFIESSDVKAYGQLSKEELKQIIEKSDDDVYISIDVDVLDPSIMPAVTMPEQGGMSWQEMVSTLKVLFQKKNVVGMDITELSPVPNLIAPNALCAQLAYKCIGYKFNKKR